MTHAGENGAMRIAPFSPDDTDAVIAFIVGIQADEFGIPITAADQPDLRDVVGFYLPGSGGFWVAKDGARIVGTIALKDIGGGDGALRKMFVAADRRGGEHRLGQKLLDVVLGHARDHGIRRVLLGTTEVLRSAHRFYEKNAFTLIAKADLPAGFPIMPLDTRFYVLDI